jgi:hypothetical protein
MPLWSQYKKLYMQLKKMDRAFPARPIKSGQRHYPPIKRTRLGQERQWLVHKQLFQCSNHHVTD